MTNIYSTSGTLTNSVQDLADAQAYLSQDDMTQYIDASLVGVVVDINWSLTDDFSWKVTVVTVRELTDVESASLSEWISGQNSDGLGEGFEQQPFAECYERDSYGDIDEDSYSMASFDWQTNDCKLTLVK